MCFCIFGIKKFKIGQIEIELVLICLIKKIIEQFMMHVIGAFWLNLVLWFIVTQLLFDMDRDIYPMVVQAVVDEGDGELDVIGYNM